MPAVARLVFCVVMFTGLVFADDARPAARVALLIGCSWTRPGEKTMIQNDVASFRSVLEKRGFQPSEIKELSGEIDRGAVLGAVDFLSRRVASWKRGEVFLYYSGHGSFSGTSARTARPALALASEASGDHIVYWDEVFSALHLPPGVRLVLLPRLLTHELVVRQAAGAQRGDSDARRTWKRASVHGPQPSFS